MIFDDLNKGCVFREEAIAWVDRLSARDFTSGDDRGEVQVGCGGRGRSNTDRLVCHTDVHRIGVSGRVDRNRFDTHLAAGAHDPKGNLATVRNEDFIEHGAQPYSMITSGAPKSTGEPSATMIVLILPDFGDGIWFIVFIASMIRSVSPSFTV